MAKPYAYKDSKLAKLGEASNRNLEKTRTALKKNDPEPWEEVVLLIGFKLEGKVSRDDHELATARLYNALWNGPMRKFTSDSERYVEAEQFIKTEEGDGWLTEWLQPYPPMGQHQDSHHTERSRPRERVEARPEASRMTSPQSINAHGERSAPATQNSRDIQRSMTAVDKKSGGAGNKNSAPERPISVGQRTKKQNTKAPVQEKPNKASGQAARMEGPRGFSPSSSRMSGGGVVRSTTTNQATGKEGRTVFGPSSSRIESGNGVARATAASTMMPPYGEAPLLINFPTPDLMKLIQPGASRALHRRRASEGQIPSDGHILPCRYCGMVHLHGIPLWLIPFLLPETRMFAAELLARQAGPTADSTEEPTAGSEEQTEGSTGQVGAQHPAVDSWRRRACNNILSLLPSLLDILARLLLMACCIWVLWTYRRGE